MNITGVAISKQILLVLAVITAFGFGFRLQAALHPNIEFSSADEVAYSRLAYDVASKRWFDGTKTEDRAYTGENQFHWSPGVPLLSGSLAYLFGDMHASKNSGGPSSVNDKASEYSYTDTPSTYWLQAFLSTGMILLVFLFASMLARNGWAGIAAALGVACYPPYVLFASEMLSETLGSFSLLAAMTALYFGFYHRKRWLFFLAGLMMGVTILARPNYLFLSLLLILLAFICVSWLRDLRTSITRVLAYLAGILLIVTPWTIFASTTVDRFVPVSSGSGASLFVGTYLPGEGNVNEMSKHFVSEIKKRYPNIAVEYDPRVSARENKLREARRRRLTFEVVAARHPDMDSDHALQLEARKNLIHYSTTQPVAFAKLIFKKQRKLWFSYARGSGYKFVPGIYYYHVFLILFAILGSFYGLFIKRRWYLLLPVACAAYAAFMHSFFLAQGRYALPTIAVLVAGGAAGATDLVRTLKRQKPSLS